MKMCIIKWFVLPVLVVGLGSVLALRVKAQTFTVLHSFTFPAYRTNSDGANPNGGLILSGSTLYGTAQNGGASGKGTVFAVNTDGTSFSSVHNFTAPQYSVPTFLYTNSDGASPHARLMLAANVLYGTTYSGGSWGEG